MSKEQTFTPSYSDTLNLEKDTVASKIRDLLCLPLNAIELVAAVKNYEITIDKFLDIIELFDENAAKQSLKDILELTDKIQTPIEDD